VLDLRKMSEHVTHIFFYFGHMASECGETPKLLLVWRHRFETFGDAVGVNLLADAGFWGLELDGEVFDQVCEDLGDVRNEVGRGEKEVRGLVSFRSWCLLLLPNLFWTSPRGGGLLPSVGRCSLWWLKRQP
jgi:hypothetical protein